MTLSFSFECKMNFRKLFVGSPGNKDSITKTAKVPQSVQAVFFFFYHFRCFFLLFGPNKKRSLLRLTWLKFLRAGGRFFFLLKFFYTQIRYANLNFSRAGNSNSDSLGTCRFCRQVAITSIRRTSLPESPRRCMCGWTVDHVTVCNELESAVLSFFGSSSA